jgi:predicted deacylase
MPDMSRRRRPLLIALLALGLVAAGGTATVPVASAADGPETVTFTIGTSVLDRPITVVHRAYPAGDVPATRVVVIGSIHGDERAGLRVVRDLVDRQLPQDVDLFLVRTANPDGVADDRRTNEHRVDLNRNFPYHWRSINKGQETYSGPAARSEPETRALQRFIKSVEPQLVITFHQPLFGVGANDKGMPVVRAIAKGMHLPVRDFTCNSACYGSFTSWVNHRTDGMAVTVEFGQKASDLRIRRAARTVLSVASNM